jgi:hypothetical protein
MNEISSLPVHKVMKHVGRVEKLRNGSIDVFLCLIERVVLVRRFRVIFVVKHHSLPTVRPVTILPINRAIPIFVRNDLHNNKKFVSAYHLEFFSCTDIVSPRRRSIPVDCPTNLLPGVRVRVIGEGKRMPAEWTSKNIIVLLHHRAISFCRIVHAPSKDVVCSRLLMGR